MPKINRKKLCQLVLSVVYALGVLGIVASGGGGGGGGDGSPPVSRIVSGQVLAPNGQVARNESLDLFQYLFEFVISTVYAEVSGLLPVDDGTQVELVRIHDNGTIANTISTTTTSGGSYTFDLIALGVDYSSDLVVIVSGMGGNQLRAFATQKKTNLGPVSEAAVRLVIEKIMLTAGSSLSNITVSEINDFVNSIDLLTALENVQSNADLETTVSSLIPLIEQNTNITDFLSAMIAPGQTLIGIGDNGNLFPLAQGDLWNRLVVDSDQVASYLSYEEVQGSNLVNNVLTTVYQYHNYFNEGDSLEDYLVKDTNGITYWGNNDPDDFFSNQTVPHQLINFPPALGIPQQIINRNGLTYPEDLDLDGKFESLDVTTSVTPINTENVSVQIGDFPQALRLDIDIDARVTLSADGSVVTVNESQVQWLSSNVGVVKQSFNSLTSGPGGSFSYSRSSELLGYNAAGNRKGIFPSFTVSTGLSTANSDTTRPGRAGVATDGSNYLVVTCRDAGSPTGLIGVFVSENNSVSSEFPIASHNCQFPWPSVAYSGTEYLVTFGRGGAVMGVTVTPAGIVGAEFMISPDSSSNWSPSVAYDGTNYLVVWGRFVDNYEIYGAIVSPTGSNITPLVVFSAPGEQISPSVDFNGSNYLVVWRDTRTGSGPSLTTDIYGTRVSPNGTVLDPAGIAIATAPGYQGEPGVASDGTDFFVVWLDTMNLGSDPVQDATFFGKLIDASGSLVGNVPSDSGIVINSSPYGKGAHALSFDGSNYLLAWRVGAFNNSPPAGIYAARISSNGALLSGQVNSAGLTVSGLPENAAKYVYPTIASSENHSLLVYTNNIELSGQLKSVEGAFVYP